MAEQLLPLVYEELRKLPAARLAHEKPEQTLQATALVHDAYIRLVDVEHAQQWDSHGHFFAVANIEEQSATVGFDLIAVSEAINAPEKTDSVAANLVKRRYFASMSVEQAARSLGMSGRTGYNTWDCARQWLRCQLQPDESSCRRARLFFRTSQKLLTVIANSHRIVFRG